MKNSSKIKFVYRTTNRHQRFDVRLSFFSVIGKNVTDHLGTSKVRNLHPVVRHVFRKKPLVLNNGYLYRSSDCNLLSHCQVAQHPRQQAHQEYSTKRSNDKSPAKIYKRPASLEMPVPNDVSADLVSPP